MNLHYKMTVEENYLDNMFDVSLCSLCHLLYCVIMGRSFFAEREHISVRTWSHA